jgi:hypothetical protein
VNQRDVRLQVAEVELQETVGDAVAAAPRAQRVGIGERDFALDELAARAACAGTCWRSSNRRRRRGDVVQLLRAARDRREQRVVGGGIGELGAQQELHLVEQEALGPQDLAQQVVAQRTRVVEARR